MLYLLRIGCGTCTETRKVAVLYMLKSGGGGRHISGCGEVAAVSSIAHGQRRQSHPLEGDGQPHRSKARCACERVEEDMESWWER